MASWRTVGIGPDVELPHAIWSRLVKHLAGYRCELCGEGPERPGTTVGLHSHHRDHDHSNNVLRNGRCLCRACHRMVHGRGLRKPLSDAERRRRSEQAKRLVAQGKIGGPRPGSGRPSNAELEARARRAEGL